MYIFVGDPNTTGSVRSGKKRRREKHHRYSPEPAGSSQVARPHKRKRKRKSVETPEAEGEQNRPALKIFVSVLSWNMALLPSGQSFCLSNFELLY